MDTAGKRIRFSIVLLDEVGLMQTSMVDFLAQVF